MPHQLPTHKTFVRSDDQAMIVCPICDTAKTLSVTRFRHRQHFIKVRCKCGNLFRVQLEFRRHLRKPTDLEGTLDLRSPARGGGKVKIINLSLSGACFEIQGIHDLKIGQRGSLIFTLDNRKKTVLVKEAVIRTVNGKYIGCEFREDKAYEKELGFYLLP